MKKAECGFEVAFFRYRPPSRLEDKDHFIIDSKDPFKPYEEFLQNERRFRNFLGK